VQRLAVLVTISARVAQKSKRGNQIRKETKLNSPCRSDPQRKVKGGWAGEGGGCTALIASLMWQEHTHSRMLIKVRRYAHLDRRVSTVPLNKFHA